MCEGDYLNHRMVYLEENAKLRTDSNFRTKENEDHHIAVSPLETLPIDMIKNFPLDYMHLICLGIMKKMLHLWLRGNINSRLRAAHIESLSKNIILLKKYIPVEFARHPRSLNELDRWKTTEFRMFLLYFGPIVLQPYLHIDYLKHFVMLHTAVRILCHEKDCIRNNKYAHQLLLHFVKTFKILYGNDNIVYNVHNLVHICEDVKMFGSLDIFSAFPFENYLKTLKKMLRKHEKPLSQLYNRIAECTITSQDISDSTSLDPLLVKPNGINLPFECVNSHKEIHLKNFKLTTEINNNCCYLQDGSVFYIDYIGFKNKIPVIIGRKYMNLRPITMYPCNSQNIKIHVADSFHDAEVKAVKDIKEKAFRIIFNNLHYIMPMLHL